MQIRFSDIDQSRYFEIEFFLKFFLKDELPFDFVVKIEQLHLIGGFQCGFASVSTFDQRRL